MKNKTFKLVSQYSPTGDQPQAIDKLVEGVGKGMNQQVLLGATGTGKTFAMANIIERVQKPTLVLAHNKTLAAQLAAEFRAFFPDNAVRYFVSYYDYYQPEAYVPARDLYIEKESQINEEIEKYRNAATQSLLTRRDVLIVASVSCIYGLGSPENYELLSFSIAKGEMIQRNKLLRKLVDIQYVRNDIDFRRGCFRVKGDTVDLYPSYEDRVFRIEFFGDEVDSIKAIDPVTGQYLGDFEELDVFPSKHYVTPFDVLKDRIPFIRDELQQQIRFFESTGKDVEALRIKQRTNYDIEMLEEVGYCNGIENYSAVIEGRKPGEPGSCLLDYFPDDYLMFIDESHITLPQVRGMYHGDRARKKNLVDYGFRLPSALDNRPLNFEEFSKRVNQAVYVSATPQEWELTRSIQEAQRVYKRTDKELLSFISKSEDKDDKQARLYNKIITRLTYDDYHTTGIAQLIIRPTGLLDPVIEVRPIMGQVEDLEKEIKAKIEHNQRVLAVTLTKRMAEELSNYLNEQGFKVQYLHSDIDTIERVEILKALRLGVYDIVVGINLLREGLDLPEVGLVAILDADKEGFLRNQTSLIQTIGRAARNVEGKVIMYADYVTGSMRLAIEETRRRRDIQVTFNKTHNISPTPIVKEITDQLQRSQEEETAKAESRKAKQKTGGKDMTSAQIEELLEEYREKMKLAADELEFFKAAEYRDMIKELESLRK
ncbi:MAG: excinuclease ABC subunit UvrB [Candidatus Dojkabacteria bacterium]